MSTPPPDRGSWASWLDAEAWARWLSGGFDAGWGPWLADASGWRPTLDLPPLDPDTLDAFVEDRRARQRERGVHEVALERLVRTTEGPAPWALGYLHGFGASRGSGEAVLEPLAQHLTANLFFGLLPGHGSTPEAHASATAEAYLQSAAETLAITRALGERVCLVGSSTGGLLATWLAATFPDDVDALVLASPFFQFAHPSGVLLRLPFGMDALEWYTGPDRDASYTDPKVREGYDERWLTEQKIRALAPIERLRGWLARDTLYARVRAPVLLLYHPDDDIVSVDAMHHALAHMQPHPASRFVPVHDGDHILMSAYVQTDKAVIRQALEAFFSDLTPR